MKKKRDHETLFNSVIEGFKIGNPISKTLSVNERGNFYKHLTNDQREKLSELRNICLRKGIRDSDSSMYVRHVIDDVADPSLSFEEDYL